MTANRCNWCEVQPAQHNNGECDECWHLPGHEGENESPLSAQLAAYREQEA